MPTFRFYVNKTAGNDLSRVVDLDAKDETDARAAAALNPDETLGDVVTLSRDGPWLQQQVDYLTYGTPRPV